VLKKFSFIGIKEGLHMIVYFILGGLFVGLQLYTWNLLSKAGKAKLSPSGLLFLIANAFIVLGLSWMYASILEHEMQAAMLGLVVFGGLGVLIAIGSYRLVSR
jgi:hypothetical protein